MKFEMTSPPLVYSTGMWKISVYVESTQHLNIFLLSVAVLVLILGC